MEQDKKGFDDRAKTALELLFERFWIIREDEPLVYQMIREREHILRRYCTEKFGYRLIVHRHFIKLEKIPVEPEIWMGIQAFQHPRDYALYCCLLAFLERKSVDEQFLLSELCEDLRAEYPSHISLDWTNYEHRKSLIRVLNAAAEFRIIRMVDGEIAGFVQNEAQEVLYEVPVMSRYFMRSYPKDLFKFNSLREILNQEYSRDSTEYRRHRVYRKLFLSPVTYRRSHDDADYLYLRNYRNRIREDIEEHTDYRFELYKNAALLSVKENSTLKTIFPDTKAISDVVLQFAFVLKGKLEQYPVNELGMIKIFYSDFEKMTQEVSARFQIGWSKALRDASIKQLKNDLLQVFIDWKMAVIEGESGMIILLPLLGRTVGVYPNDFRGSEVSGQS